ncbi:nocturnin-like [Brachyistius frenatus]|uniref:nocturnin-like n=1 Tax=Brachyistius frenatus TaxID=100188 RepID=UPI0037E8BAD8
MNPARRCSVLFSQLCVSSRGGQVATRPFSPAAVSAPAGARYCHPGVGGGAGPQLRPSRAAAAERLTHSVRRPTVCVCQRVLVDGPVSVQNISFIEIEEVLFKCSLYFLEQCRSAGPVLILNSVVAALGEGKDGFIRCPLDALNWHERKYLILEEILTYRPDILCLQEVDHYYDTFQPIMAGLGYHGSFLAKPWSPCLDVERNNGPDGCALFYRRSRFSLRATAHLRLSAVMLPTNQVAIVQTLTCRATGRPLCVGVTHLKARSGWERLRGAQGADLLRSLRSITARGAVPLVVCGDFNAEPSEDVYQRFSSSPLRLNSAYKLLSRDGQTEPAYTTWKIRPSGESRGTLDYIWYSADALSVHSLLDIPTEDQIGPDRLPSYHYPSDHLSLLCDVGFRED